MSMIFVILYKIVKLILTLPLNIKYYYWCYLSDASLWKQTHLERYVPMPLAKF